jgi:hypothetical protein
MWLVRVPPYSLDGDNTYQRINLFTVFLRVLEYYSGVLILTSNRVGEIDEAFRSRIHICLYYPKLERSSVDQVWEKNISWIKNSGMNLDIDEDVRGFYTRLWDKQKKQNIPHWNGRQIRNAFQTAIALAHWDYDAGSNSSRMQRPTLRATHFRRISKITSDFDGYISKIHGLEYQDAYSVLAEREEVRIDTLQDEPRAQQASKSARRQSRKKTSSDISSSELDSDESSYDDESNDNEDDVETLKLKLRLASRRLKHKDTKRAER